jgi:hypothetical protein
VANLRQSIALFSQDIYIRYNNCAFSNEMKRNARRFLVFIGTLALAMSPSFVNAAPSTDDLCERLHAEYLLKAQKALSEDRLEEALRFLLEAKAIANKCAESSEQPLPQKQIRESGHTLGSQRHSFS